MIRLALTLKQIRDYMGSANEGEDPFARATEYGCRSSALESNVLDGYFTFMTDSSTGNSYAQIIQFENWGSIVPREEVDQNMPLVTVLQTYPEVRDLNVLVDCQCPAFSYWGHRYNLDNQNSSVYKSEPYTTNNPDSRWSCKHLASVYNTFFY